VEAALVTGRDAAVRRHGYHALPVTRVEHETEAARSFTLDVPHHLRETFSYRPGQFCSVRVHLGETEYFRCYSMSSAPETDGDLTFTVKRVPGGVVSNWLVDHVGEGDLLEVNPPSGNFCADGGGRPVVAFCGGSGITPVLSIAKSVLATSTRSIRLLYANRDLESVIFRRQLEGMQADHPGRLEIRHHFDREGGFVDVAAITEFVDRRLDVDFYLCGPGPFMDLVEATLVGLGVGPDAIAIERFENAGDADAAEPMEDDRVDAPASIVLVLRGKKHELAYHPGDTVLETARRAGVPTPYSCEAGSCATCMAFVQEGAVAMRANDALTPEEVEEGWVLTCQARPVTPRLTVEFEPL
jgi:3-ketosteroid 9alpha-monooxygenase subunit B